MTADPRSVELLTRLIRAGFQDLRALGDALHDDIGVTAAMRAVMEWLAEHRAETVPGIARAKNVSRQHIQQLVDPLLAAGLAEARDNPAHKRSPLIDLTARGRSVFAEMRQREMSVLLALARSIDGHDLPQAIETLRALSDCVKRETGSRRSKDETGS